MGHFFYNINLALAMSEKAKAVFAAIGTFALPLIILTVSAAGVLILVFSIKSAQADSNEKRFIWKERIITVAITLASCLVVIGLVWLFSFLLSK